MITIQRFREWLLELKEAINKDCSAAQIEGIAMAVREGHMIRKLRDRRGIILCGKYPDATTTGTTDNFGTDNDVVLFLLEKVPSGQHSDEEELLHYATLQRLMLLLRDRLMQSPLLCTDDTQAPVELTIEWEYDIFGGWNGLSVGFKLSTAD